jgi:hypothetical protein
MPQGQLLKPIHESRQQKRLRKYDRVNPERIYAALWKQWNKERFGHGQKNGLLELLLRPDGVEWPQVVSQRDAEVAACVIQWLGTNVGMGFIWEAEKRIDAARERNDAARKRSNLQERKRQQLERLRKELEAPDRQIDLED